MICLGKEEEKEEEEEEEEEEKGGHRPVIASDATEVGPTGLATAVLKCFYYKKSIMYFTFGPRTASTVIQRFVSNLSSE